MNWMKPWLPLVAALAAPACTFPCDRSPDPLGPARIVSGTGQLVVTCARTKETRAYTLQDTWRLGALWDVEADKKYLHVELYFQGDKTPGSLLFEFERSLADGSYPISSAQTPVKLTQLWSKTQEGVFAFTRTREIPLVEKTDPEPGTYTSTVDMTLALKGTMLNDNIFGFTCPEPLDFTLDTTSLHLEAITNVGTCDEGDVLEGLSNIRGGH